MNQKLNAIAVVAAADLQAFVKEAEDKITEAWNACVEEAQGQETKPKLKLSFGITLDLDADKMETALTFGVKYKLSADKQIPDPDQMKLEGVLSGAV